MATKRKRPSSSSRILSAPQSPRASRAPSVPFLAVSKACGDAKSFVRWEGCEEVEELKKKLSEAEERYNKLFFINEQANIDLAHERHRIGQMERKLRFIKDNQHIFEKLKEAYMSMRYNQTTTGRKLVEIRDKGVQTWEGIVCQACLGTEKLRAELERVRASYADCVFVKKDELWKLTETVTKLRNYANNFDNGVFEEQDSENMPEVEVQENDKKAAGDTEEMRVEKEEKTKREIKNNAVKAKVKEIEQKAAALLDLCTKGAIMKRTNQSLRSRIEALNKMVNKDTEHQVASDVSKDQNVVKTESKAAVKKTDVETQNKKENEEESSSVENASEANEIGNIMLRSPSAEEVDAEYSRHLGRLMQYGAILRNLAIKADSKALLQVKSAPRV